MANSRSAAKSAKQAAKKNTHNRTVRSDVRTEVKKFIRLVKTGDKTAAEAQVRVAESKLDKAAKRNIIRTGNADRMKSRMKQKLSAPVTATA